MGDEELGICKELALLFDLKITKSTPLPIAFGYDELLVMTRKFKEPIGKGGFGTVYKGSFKHKDKTLNVAVKHVTAPEGGNETEESQFRREITTIASLKHLNLCRFVGYCYSPDRYRFLVYEYLKNGSLDRWIFAADDEGECLSWDQRYRAAADVARALKYLHHDCHDKILHLDIKPENVLLDDELRGRVSDFGLSRLVEKGRETLKTRAGGTMAYMGPEYILFENHISEKADVYSYGMMLFELVHGERNVPIHREGREKAANASLYYPKLASQRVVREENIMDLVDKKLGQVNEVEVRVMLCVALWCIQEKPDDRPGMEEVINMLRDRAVPTMLPPDTRMLMMELLNRGPEALEALFGTGETEQRIFDSCTISTVSWLAMHRHRQPPQRDANTEP